MPNENSTFYNILRSRQLEMTEDGTLVKKEKADTHRLKMALRKQHNRNKPRQRVSLDEIMGDIGGARG
tara:strand:+ start:690 stop:893 length:204 start_codon:yes stop_codon:yes gene_type:complete